jgi:hypothetical protein
MTLSIPNTDHGYPRTAHRLHKSCPAVGFPRLPGFLFRYEGTALACHPRVTLDGRDADPEQTGSFTFTCFLPEGFHYLPAQGRQSLFNKGKSLTTKPYELLMDAENSKEMSLAGPPPLFWTTMLGLVKVE